MNLTTFINGTKVNYKANDAYDVGDKAEEKFLQHLKQLGIQVTSVNHRGDPVIVAMNDDKMVAWFDLENAHGHIA